MSRSVVGPRMWLLAINGQLRSTTADNKNTKWTHSSTQKENTAEKIWVFKYVFLFRKKLSTVEPLFYSTQ